VGRVFDVWRRPRAIVPDGGAVMQSGEERFRGLLEAAPDALFLLGSDGLISLMNAQAEALFGYARGELLGQSVEVLVPESSRAVHPAHRSRYFTRPTARPMGAGLELSGRRKDGSTFPAEISLGAVEDASGTFVLAAVHDVTERKRAEVLFRGLLEAAPDAIVGVGPDGLISLTNAQTERLFGYSRAELLGQPVEMLVPEASRAVHPARQRGYLEAPTTRSMGQGMELAGRRKDGTTFPAEISLSSIQTDTGFLVSAAIRDVTDRLEAERERRRAAVEAQRLRSQRLESLGQLAGGVAHDFNNLLGVILNYTGFVARRVRDDPTAAADLEEVSRAAERAAQLTHQLLAFARQDVVRPEVLDLNAVLLDVERLLRRTLGEHVELHTVAGDELYPVLADPGQLEQALLNLALNARDAMPGGGTLTVSTGNVNIDQAASDQLSDIPPGTYVRLQVADTGTGMDRETLGRAFEPFFTRKPPGEGTGLGLATVYGIVKQSGGDVHLYSEPGMGTNVSIYFPITDERKGAPQTPHSDPTNGTETLLLVEDEAQVREMTRRILTEYGYDIIAAPLGAEGLKAFQQAPASVQLVITDVVMPGMSGPELADQIRAVRPELPVLFISGYAEPAQLSHVKHNLLEKPFTAHALAAKVRQLLDESANPT
jgi:PAS domain S-box-containing protein